MAAATFLLLTPFAVALGMWLGDLRPIYAWRAWRERRCVERVAARSAAAPKRRSLLQEMDGLCRVRGGTFVLSREAYRDFLAECRSLYGATAAVTEWNGCNVEQRDQADRIRYALTWQSDGIMVTSESIHG